MTQKKEYQIKIHSRIRLIISMIIITCSISLLLKVISKIENNYFLFLIMAIAFAISLYFSSILSIAKIKVTVSSEGFIHTWQRKFIFSKEKDIKIPFEIVENSNSKSDRSFDTFTITLKNKIKYEIETLNIFKNDEFSRFEKDFPKYLKQFKNCDKAITANSYHD